MKERIVVVRRLFSEPKKCQMATIERCLGDEVGRIIQLFSFDDDNGRNGLITLLQNMEEYYVSNSSELFKHVQFFRIQQLDNETLQTL